MAVILKCRGLRRLAVATVLAFCPIMMSSCVSNAQVTYSEGGSGETQREQLEHAVAQVMPALVRIEIVEPDHYDGRESRIMATGSGAIISPEGHIITNHHVAGKASHIICTMPNREEVPAVLIGTDAATDIAIIQLKPTKPTKFEPARFGDSSKVRVGDPVLALGSPLGLSQSVTLGVISNNAMVIPQVFESNSFTLDGENVGELVRWFAHDAEIHGGNSGGPLINMNGEIIGVNELSYGLAGAIPGNLAHQVADTIMANGHVDRAYIGLSFQPRLRSMDGVQGVLVSSVLKGSPGEKAGVKPGDLVQKIGGQPVEVQFSEDMPGLNNVVANLALDKPTDVVLLRAGKEMTISVTPEVRQAAMPPTRELRDWGMTARDLSIWTTLRLGREGQKGVYITSSSSGGPLSQAKPEIRPGQVITAVDGVQVKNVDELVRLTKEKVTKEGETKEVIVTYEDNETGEEFLTVVKVGIKPLDAPGREVQKAWLPIETQVFTKELAKAMKLPKTKGVRVTRVYDEVPADFPIKVGDIITEFDGEPIAASEIHDAGIFDTLVRQYPLNTEAELTILRNGETSKVKARLVPSPARAREMKRYRDLNFEFIVREATYRDREEPRFKGIQVDVIVDSVTGGGWASLGGMQMGDALLEINGKPIKTVADVEKAMKESQDKHEKSVILFVRRGTQHKYLEIEAGW